MDVIRVATIPSSHCDMMLPVLKQAGSDLVKAGITTTGGVQRLETSSDVQTESWQHFALTWSSGNELALYIDGELDTPTFNSPATKGKLTDATKLVIGKGEKDQGRSWNGLIDDVRIYDRVLDDAEIADLAAGVNLRLKRVES